MSPQHAHRRVVRVSTAPFVQVAEVWAPSPSSAQLHLLAGSYGPHLEFREISRRRTFSRGEGLPGRIWNSGQSIVLNHFRGGSGFVRAEAASRSGLAAGMGFPFFSAGSLRAVVVLLCAGPETAPGAFEVWDPTPEADCLRLHSGYYGTFDGFRRVSSAVRFEPGVGLPGKAWKNRFPEMLGDVSHSDSFVRSAAAVTYNLTTGLAFPVAVQSAVKSLLVLLAVRGTPLARAVEVWKPNAGEGDLLLHAAEYENADDFRLELGHRIKPGEGLAGRAWTEAFPQVLNDPKQLDPTRAVGAVRANIKGGIALPILVDDRVRAVVSLIS